MPESAPSPASVREDLCALVAHRGAVAATATVEAVQREFGRMGVEFMAVLDGERLLGVCAVRELGATLGTRFGFALNAQRPVGEHLMPATLRVVQGTPMAEVFRAVAAREAREFFDDVLLVAATGAYLGLIPVRTLVRLQTECLLANIAEIEGSRREIAEKNRAMEEDLLMACEVQLAMLPAPQLTVGAGGCVLRLAHRYQPAGGVSGDFFDLLRLDDGAAGILICDVMGHGVRSALITAMVRAMLEGLRPVAADPGLLLTRMNRDLTRILRQTGSMIFVTAGYAVLEPGAGRLRYAQAGHPTPLLWSATAGATRRLECPPDAAGPALGLIEEFEFATVAQPLAVGDRLVMFTDGVFEAARADGEEFGPLRLAEAVTRGAAQPLEDALGGLMQRVTTFCEGSAFTDDVCVIATEVVQT